jgi:hypothetical protein
VAAFKTFGRKTFAALPGIVQCHEGADATSHVTDTIFEEFAETLSDAPLKKTICDILPLEPAWRHIGDAFATVIFNAIATRMEVCSEFIYLLAEPEVKLAHVKDIAVMKQIMLKADKTGQAQTSSDTSDDIGIDFGRVYNMYKGLIGAFGSHQAKVCKGELARRVGWTELCAAGALLPCCQHLLAINDSMTGVAKKPSFVDAMEQLAKAKDKSGAADRTPRSLLEASAVTLMPLFTSFQKTFVNVESCFTDASAELGAKMIYKECIIKTSQLIQAICLNMNVELTKNLVFDNCYPSLLVSFGWVLDHNQQ